MEQSYFQYRLHSAHGGDEFLDVRFRQSPGPLCFLQMIAQSPRHLDPCRLRYIVNKQNETSAIRSKRFRCLDAEGVC